MTYYIAYRDLKLTSFERPDGTWAVRFRPRESKRGALHIAMGDSLYLSEKSGRIKVIIRVRAYIPHVQHGRYTRSGHVVADWVEYV